MAQWLAHPSEFGVKPKSVRLRRTYKGNVTTYGDVELHLVAYEMPDGTRGRGFVNGSLTWSFLGAGVSAIGDDDLLVAYCLKSAMTKTIRDSICRASTSLLVDNPSSRCDSASGKIHRNQAEYLQWWAR